MSIAVSPEHGSVVLNPDGSFTYVPQLDFHGTDRFTYRRSFGNEFASDAEVVIEVLPVNDPPVISGEPQATLAAGMPFLFTPQASDPDGDVLMFSISQKPSWAAFNPMTGTLSGTPLMADVGTTVGIVLSVTDGKLTVTLPPFSLNVGQLKITSMLKNSTNEIVIIWSSQSNVYYTIEGTPDLLEPTYTLVVSDIPGTPPFNYYTNRPLVGPRRFYRILIQTANPYRLMVSSISKSSVNRFVLVWPSLSNALYTIQDATNLVFPVFGAIESNVPGTPPFNFYTDSPPAGIIRFYRIKQQP